ncbi:ISAs1 family transposase [Rhizobium sp. LjRoot258]|uniref:ISAs1 family transposase n=1 Tax=Rhizobium sp. LjRoot258 TaxID=3342299 RepID=UPI003ECDA3CB
MTIAAVEGFEKSSLKSLLEHFSALEDPREPWRVAHPLAEVLLLVVCGTICDCDDYEGIAEWGETHLPFLRRYMPYHHGVPGGRWLTILMNRIDPILFSDCFTSWVRETWPDKPDLVAIDGKTSRRSHDRNAGKTALHLVSAFATTTRLVLGQEAVADKSNEITAIPVLLQRLGENDGLKGALVSIDAIATNATIAAAVRKAGADYLLAVKANQPTMRSDIERYFDDAPVESLDTFNDVDKGHGRIDERTVTVSRETDWLSGDRRFPGEMRLPEVKTIIRVRSHAGLNDSSRFETRYYISSADRTAERAAQAVRGHWQIENALHWTLDVVFKEDQSRLRKGHGANNMAIVRHFALNLVRTVNDKRPIKRRRKMAAWSTDYLANILGQLPR